MDIVYISKLRADTVIGVYERERSIRQTVVVDLEMASDNRGAAATDHLSQAVDYGAIADRVTTYIEQSEFQLVETLAERLAELVIAEFCVPWLRLRLSKPGAVGNAEDVGVVIERGVPH